MSTGWIKVHRKLTEWEWYDDINTSRLFIHLMITANHKDNNWRGIEIKRGSRLTSLDKLSSETCLSVSKIRTSIKKLISTKEIASKSHSQYTVFTMVNYDSYQCDDKPTSKRIASESQTNDKQIATNKNVKNVKNDNKKDFTVINDRFDDFWNMYDKKDGAAKCKSKWNKLKEHEKDSIFRSLPSYVISTPDKQYRKNPLTWLNGEHWNDDITNIKQAATFTPKEFSQ